MVDNRVRDDLSTVGRLLEYHWCGKVPLYCMGDSGPLEHTDKNLNTLEQ